MISVFLENLNPFEMTERVSFETVKNTHMCEKERLYWHFGVTTLHYHSSADKIIADETLIIWFDVHITIRHNKFASLYILHNISYIS